jgi:type III secretion protein SpaR/YscT/HrcT
LDLTLQLLTNSPFSMETLICLLFLGLARIFPLFIYAPFLGANLLPTQVKVGFALTIWAILLPKLMTTTHVVLTIGPLFLILMVKEFFVGMIMGFLAGIPFMVVNTSGMLIDNQRGTGAMAMRDPTQGTQASPIGMLYNYVLIALFFSVGGPTSFIQAFIDSYDLIPADGPLNPSFFQLNTFWMTILSLFGRIMALGLQLAAPPFLAMLMTDLFLGIVNRLAPQVQISFLGMSLKSLVACVVLFFGWTVIMNTALLETRNWMGTIPALIRTLSIEAGG